MEPNELPDYLASIRHINTYKVPSGYFDRLADEIMDEIYLPVAANIPFFAPSVNYFDGLADSVLSKIKNKNTQPGQDEIKQELEELDPLLASIPRMNVYTVPDGYFDSFTVPAPAQKQPAVVKNISRRTNWISYAAAAVIIGIIALSVMFFANNNASQNEFTFTVNYTKALSKVPDHELADYLKNAPSDAETILTSPDGNVVTNSESLFKTLLNNVSDNEIQDYLNQNGEGDEKDIKGI